MTAEAGHGGAPWLRSMLFVPGHKADWIARAGRHQADALILDLEDSVPATAKRDARRTVAAALPGLADAGSPVFVRTGCWGSGALIDDLLEVVRPGLAGVLLPK